jgi:transposase
MPDCAWHKHRGVFTRFLDDCQIPDQQLRYVSCAASGGRKSWLFAGSDRGGEPAAAIYALITTAKLNGIAPQPCLAHVFAPPVPSAMDGSAPGGF